MCQEPAPVPTRSRLETLPAELIQIIFLHCLDFNLPRSSIHIARALSDPLLYTWLIRFAFSSDNPGSHDFFTSDYLRPPLDFFGLSTLRRSELQSAILDCRWCTLPLIRKCQREYINRVIARKCQHLIISSEDRHILSHLGHRFDDLTGCEDGRDGHRGYGDLIIKAKDPEMNTHCEIAIWFNLGALQIHSSRPRSVNFGSVFQLPICAGSSSARMPDKLLRPPWTGPKLDLLTLFSLEAYIDEDMTYTRSKRALRQVIRSRDIGAFERLLDLHIRTDFCKYPIPWPVLAIHFHVALKCADGQGDPFVRLLVDKRWRDIPAHDLQLKDDLVKRVGRDIMAEDYSTGE